MEQNQDNGGSSPFKILGIVMTVLYFVLAAIILFNDSVFPAIPSAFRTPFGAMVAMYGAFRAWKVYNIYYRNREV